MVAEIEVFGSAKLTPLDFCLWGWMKSDVNKRKLDTPDELLARSLDAAGCIKLREDQLRQTTRHLSTRVAKCVDVDGGIFERLLCIVKDLLFLCNKFVI
jgi:hypothetical protein